MSAVIRWEDPPKAPRGRSSMRATASEQWIVVADMLRSRPKQWGVIYEGDNGPANWITSKVNQAVDPAFAPAGSFEAVHRKAHGENLVYARYVGGETS